jgi:hypothetical protein
MDIPSYVELDDQDIFFEELVQTLQQGLSNNGWTVPQLTNAQLTVDPAIAPDGTVTTLANLMPDGTLWYVTDHVPAVYVGKIAGNLVQFVTAAYP